MKIVHMCLACFFPDGYSYQENMLPKFHKRLGHDVEVIASLVTFDKNGQGSFMENACEYYNEYDIHVTRLAFKEPSFLYKKLKRYKGVYQALDKANPDLLFIHGCQFRDMDVVVRYLKKNTSTRVYVDNHADFSNSATNFFSKNILHKIFWRYSAHLIEPFTTKFYGVLPARVDFLVNIYKLPKQKCELLVMGADDDKVLESNEKNARGLIREQYHIGEEDFLIVTGGKIDPWKTQTILLMDAVKRIRNDHIKLLIFGSVTPELKEDVTKRADGIQIQYVGWIPSIESYNYFAAADLVIFPGRHSVFWEQVTGQGIPMIVKKWNGTQHVDLGGNVKFIEEDSTEEMANAIADLVEHPEKLQIMRTVAIEKGIEVFSYLKIAKRSIEGKK